VCTYTNVAVDNLVEGFARTGLSPLRVGGYLDKKTTAPLKIHSLEYKMEQHRLYPSLTKLEESIKQLESSTHQLEFSTSEAKTKKTAQGRVEDMVADLNKRNNRLYVLRRRHYAMEQSMQRDIFNAADVICTTCITAANHATNVIDFPIVFLDEASMSTEPASLIPLMKGVSTKRLFPFDC
jgi:regulator of nonsense transcripts 1